MIPALSARETRSSPSFTAASKLAYWLDAGIRIPGTNLRFGLDPILGLIPGFGDAAGAILAGWILVEAIRLGASRATLLRMAGNVAFDALVGAVPVLGDAFDFVWKAHRMNANLLLERHVSGASPARDWAVVVLSALMLLIALAAPFVVLALLIAHFWE